jgi:hypothetical protein
MATKRKHAQHLDATTILQRVVFASPMVPSALACLRDVAKIFLKQRSAVFTTDALYAILNLIGTRVSPQ